MENWFEAYEREYSTPNWDGYGASPISAQTLLAARNIRACFPGDFAHPHIAPGADGSVGFEWITGGPVRKIFLDVGPGTTWCAYWRLASGEKGHILRQEADESTYSKIAGMFDRLRQTSTTASAAATDAGDRQITPSPSSERR